MLPLPRVVVCTSRCLVSVLVFFDVFDTSLRAKNRAWRQNRGFFLFGLFKGKSSKVFFFSRRGLFLATVCISHQYEIIRKLRLRTFVWFEQLYDSVVAPQFTLRSSNFEIELIAAIELVYASRGMCVLQRVIIQSALLHSPT